MTAEPARPSHAVGDRVTVQTSDTDPVEITLHRHAVVLEVDVSPNPFWSVHYRVGHPGTSNRRYGPYLEEQLVRGWDNR